MTPVESSLYKKQQAVWWVKGSHLLMFKIKQNHPAKERVYRGCTFPLHWMENLSSWMSFSLEYHSEEERKVSHQPMLGRF